MMASIVLINVNSVKLDILNEVTLQFISTMHILVLDMLVINVIRSSLQRDIYFVTLARYMTSSSCTNVNTVLKDLQRPTICLGTSRVYTRALGIDVNSVVNVLQGAPICLYTSGLYMRV